MLYQFNDSFAELNDLMLINKNLKVNNDFFTIINVYNYIAHNLQTP